MELSIINSRWEDYLPKILNSSVDMVYTDPPYGKAYRSNIPGSRQWNKTGETTSKFEAPIIGDSEEEFAQIDWSVFFAECYRVLKEDTYLFLHSSMELFGITGQHLEKAGFKYKGTIVWDKGSAIGGDLRGAMKRNWEPIPYWAKGKPKLNRICVNGTVKERISETDEWKFTIKKLENVGHPTQKPLGLARRIISIGSPVGGLILDPFAGSGTLGIASIQTGRNAICIECDPNFYEKMNQRYKEEKPRLAFTDYNETA